MSSSEVSRLNSSFDDWYGARAIIEKELQAIGKALERIRLSSQLQDAFTGHLFAVHRRWCKACPPAREPGLSGGGLEKEAPTAAFIRTRAAAAHNPTKQDSNSDRDSFVSTFTQTADIMNGLQLNGQDEVDENNDDISETSVPSSRTCRVEDEESQADVNRTLEKPSNEKVVATEFIKLEVPEGVQFPDILLKLEEDQCDVDMDSGTEETPSQQIHEEDVPSQHIKSDGQSHLERTNKVPDQLIKHERDSQGYFDFDMAGSSSEAMSYQGPVEEIPLDRSDNIFKSSGISPVVESLWKDTPTCSQDYEPTSRKRLKMHDAVRTGNSDDRDDRQEQMVQYYEDAKQPRELLIERIPPVEVCSQCASQIVHFHREGVDIPQVISFILLAKQDCICTEVPVDIKTSKCFLLDKSQLLDEGDCTCDEMPWRVQKGKVCKQYVMQEQFNKPYKLWPKGKNTQEIPPNCKVLKVLKSTWVHSKVLGCKKRMICIEGHPVVFIQYSGLNNQPGLGLGNRHIRPSTSKMVISELEHVKSTRHVVHNVTKQITSSNGELPHPSKIPSYRHVTWIKEKEKKRNKSAAIDVCHKMTEEQDS